MEMMMRAAVIREFGNFDVLKIEEHERPVPRAGEILLRVMAAGLNRIDHYLREGSVTRDLTFPHVLGSDASCIVEEVGEGVSDFRPGDRVIPMPGYPIDVNDDAFRPISAAPSYAIRGIVEWGSYAQFMTVPARWVVHDQTELEPEQVAALPMPLTTGVRAVKVVGRVQSGEYVLVHAGASGTGSMNIQVARALGARVATSVRSKAKAEVVKALGAELIIELDDPALVSRVRDWSDGKGVHAVIDNLGGEILSRSLEA